ncbi:protein kinase, partial [Rhodococcus sp. NPDC049939]|uniref:serine/threonine-protein kinase n=1 Tax=Rhodococcus sp. NPDC049939 TaxID=3155511 RepID=UPI0034030AB0
MEELFGRYRLHTMLGRGGMGKVWKAFDTATDREVAVKVLLSEYAEDTRYRERFEREARAVSRLQHPNIIPIHNFGEIDGRLYIDMPLLDGVDLETLLRGQGPLPLSTAVQLVREAASALDRAHQAGLVHRDIKPSNMFIHDSGHMYLIDFGIARDQSAYTNGRTGTLAYMAPEQFDGKSGRCVDVYALTMVLFESLTGRHPFHEATSTAQLVAAHLNAEPPRPNDLVPTLPESLNAVISRGMCKEPSDRYRTAGALAQAVHAVDLGENPTTMLARAVSLSLRDRSAQDKPHTSGTASTDLSEIVDRARQLLDDGQVDAAEALFRRAAQADDAEGMSLLGNLLWNRGELTESEMWYRRGADAGNDWCMVNLGKQLRNRGDLAEA